MSVYVYIGLALLGLVLGAIGLARYLAPLFRRRGEAGDLDEVPMTPLQRRAWRGLWVGLVWCAALLWLVVRSNPVAMVESKPERLLFTGVLLLGVALYLTAVGGLQGGRSARYLVDERDRAILARAASFQSGMTLIALAAWSIGLTEVYWEAGAVPIAFPYLVFWSTFVVYLVSYSGAVLLEYRRSALDAEG